MSTSLGFGAAAGPPSAALHARLDSVVVVLRALPVQRLGEVHRHDLGAVQPHPRDSELVHEPHARLKQGGPTAIAQGAQGAVGPRLAVVLVEVVHHADGDLRRLGLGGEELRIPLHLAPEEEHEIGDGGMPPNKQGPWGEHQEHKGHDGKDRRAQRDVVPSDGDHEHVLLAKVVTDELVLLVEGAASRADARVHAADAARQQRGLDGAIHGEGAGARLAQEPVHPIGDVADHAGRVEDALVAVRGLGVGAGGPPAVHRRALVEEPSLVVQRGVPGEEHGHGGGAVEVAEA
eukprot:CAMPEP_0170283572 /NCGR_PEP_ID=MMETSP0116_2-20130129/41819_1 /TAXON_ID=400756 /ORGANISM="Durinskia baltica, Strain CSIRO CS-38" /LENGTH=289 /DNA_ID=CAMNT_0010534941 /DNA_START=16 /DNA_END=883 /DNA_ORIENTATION=-